MLILYLYLYIEPIKADYIPEKLELVCETPEKFEITINGREIDKTILGYFVDKSFKRIDISKYIILGENIISFDCNFRQSDIVYENITKAWKFESEKNKICYDTEIEAISLVGDFSVRTDGEWKTLANHATYYEGDFVISKPKASISFSNIEKQGFPFFCGEMELRGEIEVKGENLVLNINTKGINIVKIEMEDFKKIVLAENRISLGNIKKGRHDMKLTIKNTLRNLLGPHHLGEGELLNVDPGSFYKERCIWRPDGDVDVWNNGYCFAEICL